nr:uncharacterized protein LOC109156431 isoform X2 [Ipomoea batatas]
MDELEDKLMYTTVELQRLKVESKEEMRERDEARNQIQKVLTCFSQVVQTDQSPLVKPARANSWLIESNIPRTIELLFDLVSLPELSSMNGCCSQVGHP